MKKEYILITGATGFIGSHVANKLISENRYNIIAIVRKNSKPKNIDALKQKGIIIEKGDFYNSDFIEKIFSRYPIAFVAHIAALRGGGMGAKEEYFTVNVKGTELLLEYSFKYKTKKFIFISSVGVFGTIPSELPANTNTKLFGDNEYHKTKILAEQKVLHFINKGLNAYIIRPTITYGADDNGFPSTLIKLVQNKLFLLPFKDIKIHLLDVISLAGLIYQILKTKEINQRIFIAADKTPISLKKLVDLIHYHFFNKKYPVTFRIPSIFFNTSLLFFRVVNNSKWCVRIMLLSRDWYYSNKELKSLPGYQPVNTEKNFLKYLELLRK